jgi:hypothetical protein
VAEHLLGTGELIYRFLTEREAAQPAHKKRRAGQSTRAAASSAFPAGDPASPATPRSRSRTSDEASS